MKEGLLDLEITDGLEHIMQQTPIMSGMSFDDNDDSFIQSRYYRIRTYQNHTSGPWGHWDITISDVD